jgi:hypothetical protein
MQYNNYSEHSERRSYNRTATSVGLLQLIGINVCHRIPNNKGDVSFR